MFPIQFPIGVRDSLELPMRVGTESGTPCEARAHNADYSTTSRRPVRWSIRLRTDTRALSVLRRVLAAAGPPHSRTLGRR